MRWLARWARRLADVIDPPCNCGERTPCRQHPVAGPRDTAWLDSDPWATPIKNRQIEVVAPVAPGRQPYCVGCDAEHAPPLHYHTL